MPQRFAVGLVEVFQGFGGGGIADELVAGEHDGLFAAGDEAFGDFAAEHVHDHGAGQCSQSRL